MLDGRLGECRCGAVRFRASGAPVITMACHCKGCQRMSASAYSLSALYPASAFAVIEGAPVIGGLKGATRHYFCGDCMSWMFTLIEGVEGFVNIRAPLFDDTSGMAPFVETCLSEKLDWATTPAAHGYAGFPPMEDFPRLMAEFAAREG